MIVLDASVVVELLLGTPLGDAVQARISSPRETLHAPHLLDVEVAQTLRRYAFAGTFGAARGRQALDDLGDLDLVRYRHDLFLQRLWQLRTNLTAYDGVYVALSEALGAPLLTCDAKLASAPGHRARVELVAP